MFIEAAIALGASPLRVMVLHVLPSIASSVIVRTTIGMGGTILVAAALGFLGLGPPPPTPEWGRMIAESREFLPQAWWYAAAPGIAILLVVMGFNLLGDGLRDVLDPRLRRDVGHAELLSVRELSVSFVTEGGVARVLDAVSLSLAPGEIMGLVGEFRLRQDHARARDPGRAAGQRQRAGRRIAVRRPGPADARSRAARRARARPRDHLRAAGSRTAPSVRCSPIGDQIMELMRWKSPDRLARPRAPPRAIASARWPCCARCSCPIPSGCCASTRTSSRAASASA